MILFGVDEVIDTHKFVFEKEFSAVEKHDSNVLVIVDFNRGDLKEYQKETLFGVEISSVLDFILLVNTKAKYAICSKELAVTAQKYADNYLTDLKVIALIEKEEELEWVGEKEIDGAIIREA